MTRPSTREVTIFDAESGEITCNTQLVLGEYIAPGFDAIEGAVDGAEFYIDPATRQPVPLGQISPQIADNVIAGLPTGARVHAAEAFIELPAGGELQLDPGAAAPQMVDLLIEAPLHKPWQGRIEISGKRAAGRAVKLPLDQPYHLMRAQPGLGYPDEREQLDAAWKIIDQLVGLLSPVQRARIPAAALTTLEQIKAVKAKFPKPE